MVSTVESMEDVVWFKDVTKSDIKYVGGKGANLGELYNSGIPTPNGFIVTAQAYFESVKSSGILDRIKGILFNLDTNNPANLDAKARACQQEIKSIQLGKKLSSKIDKFYKDLARSKKIYVAVRSSATAEDLPGASFAGQQATFLNISGTKEVKVAILDAWASLFEARAIFYRVEKNFDHFQVGIAVPVQIMVQSEISGVMFTVDPVTGSKDTIIIESIYGLGELIVSGQITPDHYEINAKDFKILKKDIISQNKQLIRSKGGNRLLPVAKSYQKLQKLKDDKIIELAKLGKKIENHYFFPQDLEWAVGNDKIYIVQTRPITTLNNQNQPQIQHQTQETRHPIVFGAPASPGIATGKVILIHSPKELNKVQKGDVLVTEMTNPDYVPAMKKAAAIVTNLGGRTSHAAIVARELGIACVVGTGNATKKLKDGIVVTVDGARGIVYLGQTTLPKKLQSTKEQSLHQTFRTATRLYVNLAEPNIAAQVASKNVDGVGLLRAEFIMAQIGTHPKKFIEEGNQEKFIEELAQNLAIFGKSFGTRPVIYRSSDFKSNEYQNLIGGRKYEPIEPNPMLGYRGAYRYIKDPDVFKLELEALKKVRARHPNVHLMIPFVRSPEELKNIKSLIEAAGLLKDRSFKLWMMAEIPINVIILEDFIKVGIDGISIGSNDLTMLILGTDRDNEEVASEFNELNPAVLWAFEKIIKTCVKNDVTCSICGQAPSIYPELTEKLVSWGITSISVNPDAIDSTRQLIYEAEHRRVTRH